MASTPEGMPLRTRLRELGHDLGPEEIETAFVKFKQLADQKKDIFDEDIEALVSEEVSKVYEFYSLLDMSTSGGMNQKTCGHSEAEGGR